MSLNLEVIGKIASPVQTRAGTNVAYNIFLRAYQSVEEGKKYVGDEIRLPVSAPVFDQFEIGMDAKVELT